jgi:hypothetical protein
MAKTKITNTAEGPRGVETVDGTVFVEPGQTVEVEVVKDHKLYEGLEAGDAAAKRAAKAAEEEAEEPAAE